MPDMRSWFGGNDSFTSVPGGGGGGGGSDPSQYLMALLDSEDQWRRRRAAEGRAAAQPRSILGAGSGTGPAGPAPMMMGHPESSSQHAASLVHDPGEPMFVSYGTGFNDTGFARPAAGPGPNAVSAGYAPKGSRPTSASIGGMMPSAGASLAGAPGAPPDPFEAKLQAARLRQQVYGY